MPEFYESTLERITQAHKMNNIFIPERPKQIESEISVSDIQQIKMSLKALMDQVASINEYIRSPFTRFGKEIQKSDVRNDIDGEINKQKFIENK